MPDSAIPSMATLVVVAQVAVGPRALGWAPVLDEVGVGEDVEHPARRGLPSHSKYVCHTFSGELAADQMSYLS